jgi:DNA-binding NarL/FixJ family response regulator
MRILLADDQSKVRFALRVLLERQPGVEVVGEAADAADLLAQTEASRPDLVLLGWELPGLDKADLPSALRQVCPDLTIVALSARPELRQTTLGAGANEFVCKCDPPQRLLSIIADHTCQSIHCV